MPHTRIAELVGVRIRRQHLGRNILRQIPDPPVLAEAREREIHRRQIARMIRVARADEQRDDVSRLDEKIFDGRGLHFLCALRDAAGQTLTIRAAPHFERPGHAVAALGMRVLNRRHDAHATRDRTAPAHGGGELRRRMHRDAVRLHVAGNADVLRGGIGDEIRRAAFAPAVDECES